MHHFKINGYIDFSDGYGIEQLNAELSKAKGKDLFIDIDSVGGCLHTGINIYTHIRRYAEENNATITTRSSGFVASSATAIFLSGDNRIVNEFMQPFVHEPLYTFTTATTADEFRKDAETLEKSKDLLAEFYASNTNMSKSKALELMANDTWMTATECLEYGFATEIEKLSRNEAKLVASMKIKLTKTINKMSKPKLSWLGRLTNLRQSVRAELTLADVNGNSIVFPELDENSTPSEGDAATVDGNANYTGTAETEEYIFTFEDGKVTEVIDKNDVDTDEVIEELLDIIEEKDAEIERLENSLSKERKLRNAIAGKDPMQTRNGKDSDVNTDRVSAAMNRIKNRKNK